jgi:hypothetical protein
VDGAVAPEPLVDPTGSRIRGEASP